MLRVRGRKLAMSLAVLLGQGVIAAGSSPAAAAAVPDFSGFWQHGIGGIEFIPPRTGAGPVMDMNRKGGCPPAGDRDPNPRSRAPLCGARTAGIPFFGDTDNPILRPATKAVIEAANEKWRRGEEVNTASSMCMPSGVPRILGVQAPVQILQDPNNVVILYQRDHQVRNIALNRNHAAGAKPSWYGDSVGRYDGDTLVVETIGQNNRSVIDYFSTPHSERMRVTERYRVINNGRTLEVQFTVDDPETFTMPWSGIVEYQRAAGNIDRIVEERCAENNRGVEHPEDDTPDF